MRRMNAIIFITISLIILLPLTQADPAYVNSTRTSEGLGVIKQMLNHNSYFNMRWIGDSTGAQYASPRVAQGIIATWNVSWAGMKCYMTSLAPAEGCVTFNFPTETTNFNNPIPPNGHIAPFRVARENYSNNEYEIPIRYQLTFLNNYIGGNWVIGKNISFRYIHAADPSTTDLNIITKLNDGAIHLKNYGTISASQLSTNTFFDRPFSDSPINGTPLNLEVTFQALPSYNKINKTFNTHGLMFYDAEALANKKGFYYSSYSESGFDTTEHLAPLNDTHPIAINSTWKSIDGRRYTQDIINEYQAMDELIPEIYFIQLGINNAQGEGGDTDASETVYKNNLQQVINRYKSISAHFNITPKFVIVVPWQTGSQPGPRARMARASAQIAMADEDVSLINLNRLIVDKYGTYEQWSPNLLADGVHQSVNGSITFAQLMFDEIQSIDLSADRASD